MTESDGSAVEADHTGDSTDDPAGPNDGQPDLGDNVVPTAGNLMPGGLPLLPGANAYSDEPVTVTPEPDPDDPRWER